MFETLAKPAQGSQVQRQSAALDAIDTRVMIADEQHNIIYMNKATRAFLDVVEAQIHQDPPQLTVARRSDSNIDIFHKNPDCQRSTRGRLTGVRKVSIKVGGLLFGLAIRPLHDDGGRRNGTMVVWEDASLLDTSEQMEAGDKSQAVLHLKLHPFDEVWPLFISVKRATAMIGVGRTQLYQLIAEGVIETIKLGRRRLVKTASLQALADAKPQPQRSN